jgi:molybdopterin-dependent oxidoreductase alpha subunit
VAIEKRRVVEHNRLKEEPDPHGERISDSEHGSEGPKPDSEPVELTHPSTVAGGLPAITSSVKHIARGTGLVPGSKLLMQINQHGGFDCPGCAWPEPDRDRSRFEFCENGVKAVAEEAAKNLITPQFFADWPISALQAQSDYWLGKSGRVERPMLLREGSDHYEPIGWDEAFQRIGDELYRLPTPEHAAFYTSGRTSNEAAFLYQLFVRQFGCNNLPDCSNMCHESSGVGLTEVIGRGKGTVTLDDFARADAIFIIGQNPGTNHPRMLTSLQAAARRGCTIVSVNPLFEAGLDHFQHPQHPLEFLGSGTRISSLHVPVRINGDVAFFKGVMKEMLAEERSRPGNVLDHEFIDHYTEGFDQFQHALDRVEWSEILAGSGLTREQIRSAADVAMRANRTICCWAMGITQHRNGVANVQEIVNFLLLRGNLGKLGAGACPVRGHSNVQGDRTMGISERMPDWFLDKLGKEFRFEPPRRHGANTVQTIRAMHEGRIQVFVSMGGNFLSAAPDTEYTAAALRRCSLTVQVSTKLNRSHLVTGRTALILPVLGRSEQDIQATGPQLVTTENSMAIVQSSQGTREPTSPHWRSECAVVAGLAKATLGTRANIDWDWLVADYDRIRDHIERVVPGFDRYNERARAIAGFSLPNRVSWQDYATPGGRARFTVHPLPELRLEPDQFLLTTVRSHDQFNTTIYGLEDRYRGVKHGRRVVFLNRDDCEEFGFQKGDLVDLTSHFRGEQRHARAFAVYPYQIPRRCAAAYFPETNVLVPVDHFAERSNTPASKSIVITIRRAGDHPRTSTSTA